MPHWTTPNPNSQGLTAEAAKAIATLQSELDKLFEKAAAVTAREVDAVEKQVKKFYSEFESHLSDVRSRISAR
jgi:ElaB/YqjD/DUF883 family membrane-anchored ribosome-binding protein